MTVLDRIGEYRRTFDYVNYYVQHKVNDQWVNIVEFNCLSNGNASNESKRFLRIKANAK